MKIQLDKLMTEQQNPDTMSIDRMNSFEIVKAINNEDKKIALAVEKELASKLPRGEIRGLMLYYVLMLNLLMPVLSGYQRAAVFSIQVPVPAAA